MKIWTRESWVAAEPNVKKRQQWARELPLAWILEYQPTILLPGKGQIPLEPWPFQQKFLNDTSRYRAINKPRQCGISTIAAAEAAWEFLNVPGAQIVIISKDRDAAINFHKYIYNVIHSVIKKIPDAPRLLKINETETTNSIGSRIKTLAAGKEAGRSFSATHLFFDEMAFAPFADDIWQAANATLSQTKGRVTVISTPKGRANLFYRIFESPPAMGPGGLNQMGFKTFEFAWWDVPTYNSRYDELIAAGDDKRKRLAIIEAEKKDGEWYRQQRPRYTDLQWRQEFEGAFDANIGSVFSTRSLDGVFEKNYLTEMSDSTGVIDEWWSKEKVENHNYACGIDLGRKNDPTVIITYDTSVRPAEVVDFKYIEAGSAEWNMIQRVCIEHLQHWTPEAVHDGTGVGDTLTEALYGLSEPFMFTKNGKQNIVERMQHAFDFRLVRIPKIPTLYREHQRYQWDDKDITQDTVMANGMAISIFHEVEDAFVGVIADFSYTGMAA